MNLLAASALVNFVTSGVLGVFVVAKSRSNRNNGFFIFCVSVAFWSLAYYLWQISESESSALFWSRVLMAGAIFIPVAYLHFVYALVGVLKKRSKFLLFSYVLFFVFLLTDFTSYFVSRVEPQLSFSYWPVAGPAFGWFLVVWFLYVIYSTYLLIRAYRDSVGIARLQLRYVIIGMIIGFVGGSTNYFMWYRISIPPFANILVSVYVGTIAYAILRYRLMDIRIVARKVFMYVGSAVFVYVFFYSTIWFYNHVFGSVFSSAALAMGVIIAPLFVAAFYGLDKGLKIFANRYLFASLYNYQETINRLTDELNYYIDLDKIVGLIVDTIKDIMQLDRAGVLLINEEGGVKKYKIAKVMGFDRQNGISLVQDNFLTHYLQKKQKPLVLEELALLSRDAGSAREKEGLKNLYEHMKRIEASLCLPLVSSGKLIGIIVLGAKISGDAYTKEDLELLNTLSKQAGIAIENARLYKQVQEFGQKLTAEVDRATRDLKKTNIHLQSLIKMKNEFLQIASHQLRTPVSVMRGMLDMIREGGELLTVKQRNEMINRAYLKSSKLNQVIDDILSATEMDVPNFDISGTAHPVDLKELAHRAVVAHRDEAADKGLTLTLEAKDVLKVNASETYLPQAITNLIDNAIKYTKEGSVVVKVYREGDMAVLAVSDTGIGVPEEDLSKLWMKFKRATNAKNMHTDGSGLGLFIIKKIVEGHVGGEVFVESKLGRGSTFGFKLPMIKEE